MAHLLVIGASRGIGLETVRAGLKAGHRVRAFARSAASIDITDERLQKVTGDALNGQETRRALDGIDAAIQTIGVNSVQDLIFGSTLFSRATRVLVDAMEDAGVKRLIAVTGAGAGDSRGRINPLYDHLLFPILLQRVYADKDIAEDIIRASGLDWTIIRPGLLTNGAYTGRYKLLPDPKDWRAGFISRADVADCLIAQVSDTSMIGKTPLLNG